ncbi:MAG: sterol desaturase family protein [Acidimicrobiaceae bacterium]|nr:sterol desaturase family protein [Acidimicrobiaceae bacterium]MYC43396.1 sterol desaturase family protein [Acidimicrobiaceae bacterium]MYH88067.1 sterol desaturase family protein [Acidimicrobiaceae bacterium]
MADTSPTNSTAPINTGRGSESKGHEPTVPITVSPILDWPPRPVATLRYLLTPVMLPYGIFWVALAALTWNWLTPSMDRMATLDPGWMLEIYLRNVVLLSLVAGSLHLFLYTRQAQQQRYKYNQRWLSSTNKSFLWTNQTWDNIFWSLVSGCGIWTVYESLTLWAYANDWVASVQWGSAWPYLGALTVGIFLWSVIHFYLNHRLLHVRWFYDHAHYLHHRNVNTGPWSGISMHPLEHVIYFSVFLLWWVVPAHPFIVILSGLFNGLSPAVSHSGFERFEVGRRQSRTAPGADYYHHLHHRYFECNYGNRPVPIDKLFGTFHDGTPEAHARMKERMRARRGTNTSTEST